MEKICLTWAAVFPEIDIKAGGRSVKAVGTVQPPIP